MRPTPVHASRRGTACGASKRNVSIFSSSSLGERSQCYGGAVAGGRGELVRAHGQARETLCLPTDRDLEAPIGEFSSIASALEDLKAGKFVVVLDDESRENEGDLIMSADMVTTEAMAFMVEHTSGVVCIGMEGRDLDRLKLPLMVRSDENEDTMYTAFTVTVDLRDGITTGISASDRAKTLRKMADPSATPEQFRRPGHIFPLRCRTGGVLVRPGHTEASVDLARLSGSFPAGVLSEIVNKRDGSMARTPDLLAFAKDHGLKCISIADLMRYRLRHEQLIRLTSSDLVVSQHGTLHVHTFKSLLDGSEHMAVVLGSQAATAGPMPLHVQVLGSMADMLGCSDDALTQMAANGKGVNIYINSNRHGDETSSLAGQVQELRLLSHLRTTSSSQLDLVDYGLAAQMLSVLEINTVAMVANDTTQRRCLEACGVAVQDGVEFTNATRMYRTVSHNL